MSNTFLIQHQDEILTLFKNHFKEAWTRSTQLSFLEIQKQTLLEIQFPEDQQQPIAYLNEWFDLFYHQSFLKKLLISTSQFEEIILHNHKHAQTIFNLNHSKKEFHLDLQLEDFQFALEILALKNNQQWNSTNPFTSFKIIIDGFDLRATLIHHEATPEKSSKLFLRNLSNKELSPSDFSTDEDFFELIEKLIASKNNILISGSTGSGKTSFLQTLLSMTSSIEHIIILEDTHEIKTNNPNASFLISSNTKGHSLKDYCSYAMRMSPDRIILGEMRSTEVVPFLLSMNTGHKGLMSTIHASSARDAISRLNLLFGFYSENSELKSQYITRLICQNIEYVIHLENKKIKEIIKLLGSEGDIPFYEEIYSAS